MRDVEQEAAVEKRDRRVGEFLAALGEGVGVGELPGGRIDGFRVRLPTEEDPGTLIIVRASSGSTKVVAFVGAYDLSSATLAWRARSRVGRMKWREDRPWKDRDKGQG